MTQTSNSTVKILDQLIKNKINNFHNNPSGFDQSKPMTKRQMKRWSKASKESNKWRNSSLIKIPKVIKIKNSNPNINKVRNIPAINNSMTLNMTVKPKITIKKNQLNNKPLKKTWAKEDEDFTLVPIWKDKYCSFYSKFGNCKRGSKWYVFYSVLEVFMIVGLLLCL